MDGSRRTVHDEMPESVSAAVDAEISIATALVMTHPAEETDDLIDQGGILGDGADPRGADNPPLALNLDRLYTAVRYSIDCIRQYGQASDYLRLIGLLVSAYGAYRSSIIAADQSGSSESQETFSGLPETAADEGYLSEYSFELDGKRINPPDIETLFIDSDSLKEYLNGLIEGTQSMLSDDEDNRFRPFRIQCRRYSDIVGRTMKKDNLTSELDIIRDRILYSSSIEECSSVYEDFLKWNAERIGTESNPSPKSEILVFFSNKDCSLAFYDMVNLNYIGIQADPATELKSKGADIGAAIAKSDSVVCYISKDFLTDPECISDLKAVHESKKDLIPINASEEESITGLIRSMDVRGEIRPNHLIIINSVFNPPAPDQFIMRGVSKPYPERNISDNIKEHIEKVKRELEKRHLNESSDKSD